MISATNSEERAVTSNQNPEPHTPKETQRSENNLTGKI